MALAFFCATCLVPGGVKAAGSSTIGWTTISAARSGPVTAYLVVKNRATMADEEWIGIEFQNDSSKNIEIDNLDFSIDARQFTLPGRNFLNSGSLASGTDARLFPESRSLPPGRTRRLGYISRYNMNRLGLPPKEGLLVKATFTLRVRLKLVGELSTGDAGIPFQFEWLYPEPEGFAVMRERVRQWLADEVHASELTDGVHALLTAEVLPVEEVLQIREGLLEKERAQGYYWAINDYLVKHHGTDAVVVQMNLDKLRSRNPEVLEELRPWQSVYLEPLIEWCPTANEEHLRKIVKLVGRQSSQWSTSTTIPLVLSTAVRKTWPILLRKPEDLWTTAAENGFLVAENSLASHDIYASMRRAKLDRDLYDWEQAAKLAGLTGDASWIPHLAPYLDDKTVIRDLRLDAGPQTFAIADRICDVALQQIIALSPSVKTAVQPEPGQRFGEPGRVTSEKIDALHQRRDKQISRLKQMLASGNLSRSFETSSH